MIWYILISFFMYLMGGPPANNELMPRLVEVPGERVNSHAYYHEGYVYHKDSKNARIFRCQTRSRTQCRGKVYTAVGDRTVNRARTEPHDCDQVDFLYLQKLEFKRELLQRCQETDEDFIDIYNNLIVQERHEAAARALGFQDVRPAMRAQRAREVPVTPQTLLELTDRIRNFQPINRYYAGHVEGPQNSIALIFINPDLRNGLINARSLFGNGTFGLRPTDPRDIAQIYTFHFAAFGVGFPPIVCLTNRRITELYVAMLRFILNEVPELRNLDMFHVDFERSMINAVRIVLPNAIVKYWKRQLRIGDTAVENRALALILALPFLRPADMEHALGQIVLYMINERIPNSDRLARYWTRMWLPLAHVITVYRRRIRTNNFSETFHNQARRTIGLHQTLWRFLGRLASMMIRDAIYYDTVMNGNVRPVRSQSVIGFDTWLDNNEHLYEGLTPFQYLERVAVERDRLHFHQFVGNVHLEDEIELDEAQQDAIIDQLHQLEPQVRLVNVIEPAADIEVPDNPRRNARGGRRPRAARVRVAQADRGGQRGARRGQGVQPQVRGPQRVRANRRGQRGRRGARGDRGRGQRVDLNNAAAALEAQAQPVVDAIREARNQEAANNFRYLLLNRVQAQRLGPPEP